MPGELAFCPAPGWKATDLPAPAVAAGSPITLDTWSAWRAPADAPGRAVAGCFGMDLDTWIDEAMPIALERLAANVAVVAKGLDPSIARLRVLREERSPSTAGQALGSPGDEDARVVARTVVGFTTATRARACFAVCVPTSPDCERALSAAGPAGFVPPPPATLVARGVACGVHHPRVVGSAFASAFFVAGIVLVWTRPRPRRRRI